MSPEEATKLYQRNELFHEFRDLLYSVPQSAADLLPDPRVADEPEIQSILADLRDLGTRFTALSDEVGRRLDNATWEHITFQFDLVRGDIVEFKCYDGTAKIILDYATPWNFHSNEFAISGPSVLATGKPGKRSGTLFIHQQQWKKMGHYDGDLPKRKDRWDLLP